MTRRESEADRRERAYAELRAIVSASPLPDVERWLRDAIADYPDWLIALVLDDFGYDVRHPGRIPIEPDDFYHIRR
jgi:hypothetical protein